MYQLSSRSLLRRYGSYKNESSGVILQNPGIDFKAKPGTRVVSSAEGIVSLVYNVSGYNTVIIVEHSQGIRTVYGNLFRTYVRKGDNVQKGQPLGITGETI
ncbi:MAG: murein hydrolase activator EnvC family protein, partial [Candidatus Kapaibacterium sp.]